MDIIKKFTCEAFRKISAVSGKRTSLLAVLMMFLGASGAEVLLSRDLASAGNNFSGREIVGYFPNWRWYDRDYLVNPETIDYGKYTIINYAFFRPMADGSIESTDRWADENLLLGPREGGREGYNDRERSLPYLARSRGVKVLASIGGWNDSYSFSAIAADPGKKQNFIQHCVSLILKYDLDGIDIDWEYPGYAPHGGTSHDRANFTRLISGLRSALDYEGQNTGRRYLLTACFGASRQKMEHIEWKKIINLLDMVNLMTYDFHVPYSRESNHHSPLHSPLSGNPESCVDGAFYKLTAEFGVPPEMINIGLAFYGKALKNCTGLYAPHDGYDKSAFPEDGGQPQYYDILRKKDSFTYHWDERVKNPYLLGKHFNTFVTYDNPRSISYKARFAADNNAGGVIIWDLTADYVETHPGSGRIEGTPLLDSVSEAFKGGDSSCFIASAAYGSCHKKEVIILRAFRDNLLLTNNTGRFLTSLYQSLSPEAAKAAADKGAVKLIIRMHLAAFVRTAGFLLNATGK